MNGMLTLVFSAIVAAAAADEMIPPDAPWKPTGACSSSPALCTGPAVLGGKETMLTYVCPETSEAPAVSTVHVTTTVLVTIPADGVVKTTVDPAATSVLPGLAPEPEVTTTVKTTSTILKTIVVTHKPTSSSAISKVPSVSTEPESIETLITATSMFELPTPAFPSSSHLTSSSSVPKFNLTESFTLLPIPTQSHRTSSLWIPSVIPPMVTGVPSSPTWLSLKPSKTMHHSLPNFGTGRPTGHVSDVYSMLPMPMPHPTGHPGGPHSMPHPPRPTGNPTGHLPIPPEQSPIWHFPTLRVREVNGTATMSAMPTHTGGAEQVGVSVAALFGAVAAAAYLV